MCTFKEHTRCEFNNISYKKFPKLIVVSSLESNITCINVFPRKDAIFKTLSPSAVVLVIPKIDATDATLKSGSYVHCKIKERSTNNIKTSIVAHITLRRSNKRGGHYLMSLKMGHQQHRYQWQELTITDAVIDCVEKMATEEESPEIIDGYPNV